MNWERRHLLDAAEACRLSSLDLRLTPEQQQAFAVLHQAARLASTSSGEAKRVIGTVVADMCQACLKTKLYQCSGRQHWTTACPLIDDRIHGVAPR